MQIDHLNLAPRSWSTLVLSIPLAWAGDPLYIGCLSDLCGLCGSKLGLHGLDLLPLQPGIRWL